MTPRKWQCVFMSRYCTRRTTPKSTCIALLQIVTMHQCSGVHRWGPREPLTPGDTKFLGGRRQKSGKGLYSVSAGWLDGGRGPAFLTRPRATRILWTPQHWKEMQSSTIGKAFAPHETYKTLCFDSFGTLALSIMLTFSFSINIPLHLAHLEESFWKYLGPSSQDTLFKRVRERILIE